jgi:hypothetical protein
MRNQHLHEETRMSNLGCALIFTVISLLSFEKVASAEVLMFSESSILLVGLLLSSSMTRYGDVEIMKEDLTTKKIRVRGTLECAEDSCYMSANGRKNGVAVPIDNPRFTQTLRADIEALNTHEAWVVCDQTTRKDNNETISSCIASAIYSELR